MKVIDTREYVSVLKQLTDDGREVSMRIAGNSMAPFLIHERDTIFFQKPEAKLKKGDMVFFKRRNGQYIMHRIHHVNYVKGYLFDVLMDVGDDEYIATYLRNKGYNVEKI